jgi:hypothetical protein
MLSELLVQQPTALADGFWKLSPVLNATHDITCLLFYDFMRRLNAAHV